MYKYIIENHTLKGFYLFICFEFAVYYKKVNITLNLKSPTGGLAYGMDKKQ